VAYAALESAGRPPGNCVLDAAVKHLRRTVEKPLGVQIGPISSADFFTILRLTTG